MGMESLTPSNKARELVRGSYDLHVHSGPDVMKRIASDIEIARAFQKHGLGGYVIKSHYTHTGGRAQLTREMVPGVDVIGAITLNGSVGGMNPSAIEMAARDGVKLVWLPTVDAVNEADVTRDTVPGAKLPFWAKVQEELRELGVASDSVPVVTPDGTVLPETRAVLRSISRHDLILATGHLSRDEIFAVVDAAVEEGVKRIVITHPEFPSQNISVEDQIALAERGAMLERCFVTFHSGKCSWETMFENIRAVGFENSFFSSDLGQPHNPPIEDGLALMAQRCLDAGFTDDEIHQMAVENTCRLARG
jgi:Family of unknown function (DUF6282)